MSGTRPLYAALTAMQPRRGKRGLTEDLTTEQPRTMPREIADTEGTTWSCIQAFAGLGGGPEKSRAARVEGAKDHVHVVCTPSGGAHSVRLDLPQDWETALSDADLLGAIGAALAEG